MTHDIAKEIEKDCWGEERADVGLSDVDEIVSVPTDIELQQQERIAKLEKGLNDLLETAYQCDSWDSFPSKALEDAEDALSA